MSNQLTTIGETKEFLESKREQIFVGAMHGVNQDKCLSLICRAVYNNPELMNCNKPSLLIAAQESIQHDLMIDGVLGHAYLVPYKGEAKLVVGYKGMIELAYRSERVAVIDAKLVYEGDVFDYRFGSDEYLNHSPQNMTDVVTHAWALCKTTKGGCRFIVMTADEIDKHKVKYSKNWRSKKSAWQTSPDAMKIKTVVRALYKLLPVSAEHKALVEREEYIERGVLPESVPEKLPTGAEVSPDTLDAIAKDLASGEESPATDEFSDGFAARDTPATPLNPQGDVTVDHPPEVCVELRQIAARIHAAKTPGEVEDGFGEVMVGPFNLEQVNQAQALRDWKITKLKGVSGD
tara:strand:- start:803 stop:1846 length:1044 start_codon:yes stop_codon:yes gene_type:complete